MQDAMQVDATRDQAKADGIARLRAIQARWLEWRAEKRERARPDAPALRVISPADWAGKPIPTRFQSALSDVGTDPIGYVLKSQAREVGWMLCCADKGQIDLMQEVAGHDDWAPGFSSWLAHRWDRIGSWCA
jgi:hypothetical protein